MYFECKRDESIHLFFSILGDFEGPGGLLEALGLVGGDIPVLSHSEPDVVHAVDQPLLAELVHLDGEWPSRKKEEIIEIIEGGGGHTKF